MLLCIKLAANSIECDVNLQRGKAYDDDDHLDDFYSVIV